MGCRRLEGWVCRRPFAARRTGLDFGSYRLLLRHGLRPGRNKLDSPSFPPGLVTPAPSRHSRRVSSFPPGLVIPTGSRHSRRVSSFPPHLVIPTRSRHSHQVSSFPPGLVTSARSRHSHRVSSFPLHPVIPPGSRHSRVGGNLPERDWTHRLESCRPLAIMPQKVNGTFLDCSFAFGVDCLYNHSENPMRGSGCHE